MEPTHMNRINILLDEWCLIHKPPLTLVPSSSSSSSLDNHHTDGEEVILSRLEVVLHILTVINGFDSTLFIWNNEKQIFVVASGYTIYDLNSNTFRNFLLQYAQLGTQFRQMFEFTCKEYFRGQTFLAFQNVLGNILQEIIHKTIEIREHFLSVEKKQEATDQSMISMLALFYHLDSDTNGNIILTIKNLYEIYLEVVQELQFNLPRQYCNQTLTAICKRVFIPCRRIRNIVFTMINYCLQPIFNSIEYLLTEFESMTQLSDSSEFLFSSDFKTDEDLYFSSYSHNELNTFWNTFFHFDNQLCQNLHLFSDQSLKLITEAIKGSFVLRKNGILSNTLCNFSGKFLSLFHSNLNAKLRLYIQKDEQFDIDNQSNEQFYELNTMESIKDLIKLPNVKMNHFKCFDLPIRTVFDLQTIIEESLSATFSTISLPIIQEFLEEFRCHHLKLFHYYTDFFLVQNPHHVLQYVYFLFATILDIHKTKSFDLVEAILKNIHKNSDHEFENVLSFFNPNLFMIEKLDSISDHSLHLELFNRFYFLPSFSNEYRPVTKLNTINNRLFYDFWPLALFFNPKITEVFNQLFQFLLKLRYAQYIIGNNFFLSENFRENKLTKENYLFRYRLLNLVVLLGHQMESRLGELVQITEQRLKCSNTFEDYFLHHQKFLEKLSNINEAIDTPLVQNILNSITKFYIKNTSNSLKTLRRLSIYDAFIQFDQMSQVDFFGSGSEM